MLESNLFHAEVFEKKKFIIGYSVYKKTGCEVLNYVSPTLRILRFLDGCAQWKIGEGIETFHQGDIVVLSNLIKRNIHDLLSPEITYEVFDFYPSALSSDHLRSAFYQGIHKVIGAGDGCVDKLDFLLNCLKQEIIAKQDDFQIFSIRRLLDLLALEVRRGIGETDVINLSPALFQIAKSVQYIAEHFNEDLSITDLAKKCNYSHGYYTRLFRQYIGMSPVQYLVNIRLQNVLHLINTQEITVLDAAYQSGFRSSSGFYKAFHVYSTVAPKDSKDYKIIE